VADRRARNARAPQSGLLVALQRQRLEAIRIALRVLTPLIDKRDPDPSDVKELEAYLGPKPEGVSLDKWTRDGIEAAIRIGSCS
jgi:hypothetical protein